VQGKEQIREDEHVDTKGKRKEKGKEGSNVIRERLANNKKQYIACLFV